MQRVRFLMMYLKLVVLFALLFKIQTAKQSDPRMVMKKMSATIGENVLICQEQMGFNQEIIKTFLVFWSDATPLDDPNVGCAFMCVLKQLELVEEEGALKRENAVAFFTAKGSDQFTTDIIIELYDMCKEITRYKQECYFGIELARCFRGGVLMRGWAPEAVDPAADDEDYDYNL